jgi:hypothetical protein
MNFSEFIKMFLKIQLDEIEHHRKMEKRMTRQQEFNRAQS